MRGCLCVLYLLCLSGELAAQSYNPYVNPGSDPRVRRTWREKAVATVGAEARKFVESPWGDDAVAALFAVSRPVAVKLVAFYNSGELDKLPRPQDLLRMITQQRNDEVAVWAIHHGHELTDRDSFDAYLANPLEYALGLKSLPEGAAELRALRLQAQANQSQATFPLQAETAKQGIIVCVLILGTVAVVLWWRQRQKL